MAGVSIGAPEALGEAEEFMKGLEAAGLALQQDATLVKAFQSIGVAGTDIENSLNELAKITSFNGPVGDIFSYVENSEEDTEFFLGGLLNTLPFKFDQAIDVSNALPKVADVTDPCGATGVVKQLGAAGDAICASFDDAGNAFKAVINEIKKIVDDIVGTVNKVKTCVFSFGESLDFKKCE